METVNFYFSNLDCFFGKMETTLIKLDHETRRKISETRVDQRHNICIQGPPGAGKTTIVSDLAEKGHKILYVTLNNALASYFGKKYEKFPNVFCSTVDSYTYLACIKLIVLNSPCILQMA